MKRIGTHVGDLAEDHLAALGAWGPRGDDLAAVGGEFGHLDGDVLPLRLLLSQPVGARARAHHASAPRRPRAGRDAAPLGERCSRPRGDAAPARHATTTLYRRTQRALRGHTGGRRGLDGPHRHGHSTIFQRSQHVVQHVEAVCRCRCIFPRCRHLGRRTGKTSLWLTKLYLTNKCAQVIQVGSGPEKRLEYIKQNEKGMAYPGLAMWEYNEFSNGPAAGGEVFVWRSR